MNADSVIEEPRLDRRGGRAAVVTNVARRGSHSFWAWFRENRIDGILVLFVMLWAIAKAVEWAFNFPYDNMVHGGPRNYTGAEVAMILGAVLGPMGILQALLFNIYVKLKSINGTSPDKSA